MIIFANVHWHRLNSFLNHINVELIFDRVDVLIYLNKTELMFLSIS